MGFPKGLKSAEELAKDKPHGTRLKYMAGCKCMLCRAANSNYEAERKVARNNGEWNGIVSARRARTHIRNLSKKGVGRRAISDASDVCTSTIQKIKAGRKTQIRAETERRILQITKAAIADSSLVCAKRTWDQIESLLIEGFTEKDLAKKLGYKNGYLQLGKVKILAKTKVRIEKLYNFYIREETENYEDTIENFLDEKKGNLLPE